MSNLLVIARKYNDIFYAISTDEWSECQQHYLLMITDRLDASEYPMSDNFDKVYTIHTQRGIMPFVNAMYKISNILQAIEYDIVMVSNLAMVQNLFVLNNNKTKSIILLEDGIMNYYNFIPSRRVSKMLVMGLLGINEEKVLSKIKKTYLLEPSSAVYYYGERHKIELKSNLFAEKARLNPEIQGKSIFVGQDLYWNSDLTVEEYNTIVNKVITEYNIDFYLPHTRSDKEEDIHCKQFNIVSSKATLEIYASVFDFELYSFSSSVLYTTKIINPHVRAVALRHPKMDRLNSDSIIFKHVDQVINI